MMKGKEMRKVWITVGEVTDADAYNGEAVVGQPEYQFSDGPVGWRSSSADYISLEKGLKEHSGCQFFWDND